MVTNPQRLDVSQQELNQINIQLRTEKGFSDVQVDMEYVTLKKLLILSNTQQNMLSFKHTAEHDDRVKGNWPMDCRKKEAISGLSISVPEEALRGPPTPTEVPTQNHFLMDSNQQQNNSQINISNMMGWVGKRLQVTTWMLSV